MRDKYILEFEGDAPKPKKPHKLKACFLSNNTHWRTPEKLLKDLTKEYGILYDPCPSNPLLNGLVVPWRSPAFVNPPYKKDVTIKWVKKAVYEYKKGCVVIMLLPSRTDGKWFHDYILPYATEIRFIRGRLRFNDAKGISPFPSLIAVFKPVVSMENNDNV